MTSSTILEFQNLPVNWKMAPIWTLFRRIKRTGFENEELLSVYRDYGVIPKSSRSDNHNVESEDLSSYQLVEKGDLVVNKMKAWQGSVALSEYRGIVSPAYFVYKVTGKCHPKFYHYLLRSALYKSAYNKISKGVRVGQWDLEPQEFRKLPILIPPIGEQIRIAKVLDSELEKIDSLIEQQRNLIEILKERQKTYIFRLVTKGLDENVSMKTVNVDWLGSMPSHWKFTRTRFLCKIRTGSGDTQDSDEFGDYPFYVRSDIPLKSSKFEFDGKSVLTAGDGAGVGKVFHLVEGKFMAHQRVYVLSDFKLVIPEFFYYYFKSTFALIALDGSAKSTVDSVRRPMLSNLPVTLPPIEEQREIVEKLQSHISRTEEIIRVAEAVVIKLHERRESLINSYVTKGIGI